MLLIYCGACEKLLDAWLSRFFTAQR